MIVEYIKYILLYVQTYLFYFNNKFKLTQTYFNYVIKKYKLCDWKLTWNNAFSRAGICYENKKTISISRHYIKRNNWNNIKNIILHEISHAIVGNINGHNEKWLKTFKKLGGNGKMYCNNYCKNNDYKYIRYCINIPCDNLTSYHLTRRKKKCTNCRRNMKYIISPFWKNHKVK